jgi:hypothetical protein
MLTASRIWLRDLHEPHGGGNYQKKSDLPLQHMFGRASSSDNGSARLISFNTTISAFFGLY